MGPLPEHAAHVEFLTRLLNSQVRSLEQAVLLKTAASYPDIIETEASPLLEALRATAMAGLSQHDLTASLNSTKLALGALTQDQNALLTTEEGRLVAAFVAFVARLKSRSRKELLRFLQEDEERMWAVLCTGTEFEVRALYRVSESTLAEFALTRRAE